MRRLLFAASAQLLTVTAFAQSPPNLFPTHPAPNPTHVAPAPLRLSTFPTQPLQPPQQLLAPPPVQPPAMPGQPQLLPPSLAPEVTLPQKETLARIDPNGLSARRVNDRWAVTRGFEVVRDFGANQQAAEEFVRVLRDLRPTEWGTVGTDRVVVEYGLTAGAAQKPAFTPKTSVTIDADSLRVERVRGVWVLRDDANILLNFGRAKDDAEQAVAVIREYEFNRIGQVGPVGAGVTFLFAQEELADRARPKPSVPTVYADLQRAVQEEQLTRTGIEVPGGGVASSGERILIDPNAVELKRDRADWKLVHGADELANFGPSEWSARDALKLVQNQRFTEFCRFNDEVTFFLVNGQPPNKVPFAVQAVRFDRDALAVKPSAGGRFGIYEGFGRQLFACDSEKEAKELLKLLQKYGFDTSCQIGLGAKSSLRFLAKTGR